MTMYLLKFCRGRGNLIGNTAGQWTIRQGIEKEKNMQNSIAYSQKNEHIECIYYRNALLSYPSHTHSSHVTFGYVLKGKVGIMFDGKKKCYYAGEYFIIPLDNSHAIEAVDDTPYSMVCVCVAVGKIFDGDSKNTADRAFDGDGKNTTDKGSDGNSRETAADVRRLKQLILKSPENVFSIEDMAHHIGISPYHMIRQFKAACGLTPHQFQIQCRVRKAQRLLEQGESVTEVAYATGFCDQSHFDRCFQKIVRLTPREYKHCLRR